MFLAVRFVASLRALASLVRQKTSNSAFQAFNVRSRDLALIAPELVENHMYHLTVSTVLSISGIDVEATEVREFGSMLPALIGSLADNRSVVGRGRELAP